MFSDLNPLACMHPRTTNSCRVRRDSIDKYDAACSAEYISVGNCSDESQKCMPEKAILVAWEQGGRRHKLRVPSLSSSLVVSDVRPPHDLDRPRGGRLGPPQSATANTETPVNQQANPKLSWNETAAQSLWRSRDVAPHTASSPSGPVQLCAVQRQP